jgi:tRNA pseudouridine13 synthase
LFNQYLARRPREHTITTVLAGDILQKRDSGGLFGTEDVEADQQRLDAGDLVVTGPMFGHKMKAPAPGSAAAELETALLDSEGIELASFAHLGKLALGTRRALLSTVDGVEVQAIDDALDIHFALPSGSYATAVLREVIKGPSNFPE